MFIWKISQEEECGYDTWDSAIVIAPCKKSATETHPNGYLEWDEDSNCWWDSEDGTPATGYHGWTVPSLVECIRIGIVSDLEAARHEIVLTSFNAG